MSYTAGEIISDVRERANDEKEKKLRWSWLLHLLNLAQDDFAKQTHYFNKEYKHTIDTRFNAFTLPVDFLELKDRKSVV